MRVLYSVFSHEQAIEDLSKSSAISGSLLWSGCQQKVCSLYSLGKKKNHFLDIELKCRFLPWYVWNALKSPLLPQQSAQWDMQGGEVLPAAWTSSGWSRPLSATHRADFLLLCKKSACLSTLVSHKAFFHQKRNEQLFWMLVMGI